jgi:hypothetical protein
VPLEVIALYRGHARPITTHAYVEADLKIKADCLRRLTAPNVPKDRSRDEQSRLLAFLEAVRQSRHHQRGEPRCSLGAHLHALDELGVISMSG